MSIEIRHLTFSYKSLPMCRKELEQEKKVLDNFSADFKFGKITALTGPNGAGKSTLARIIMGIIKPESGNILIDGQDIEKWSLAERGVKVGYVMQNPARQIFSETVLEEVMFGLKNQGLEENEARNLAMQYTEMFGLTGHIDDFPFNLSHGEKQRLVLASVLAMKPGYLMLDEPTAGLDIKHKEILGAQLQKIARPDKEKHCSGCGIIVISHDRKFIAQYCDSTIDINKTKSDEEVAVNDKD